MAISTKFHVSEITTPSNLNHLNQIVLEDWHNQVNRMDEIACQQLSEQESDTTGSYYTIFKQIRDKFLALTKEGHRVFATFSIDSQGRSRAIEAIVTARWKENGIIWCSYAVTNPHNLPLEGLQKKQQHGAVIALAKYMLQMVEKKTLEACVIDKSIPFCQKLGFRAIEDKTVARDFECYMQAGSENVRQQISNLPIEPVVIPEPNLANLLDQ